MLVIISCLDLVLGKCFPMEKAVGFGGSTSLIFLAPVVLLFSYADVSHKNLHGVWRISFSVEVFQLTWESIQRLCFRSSGTAGSRTRTPAIRAARKMPL